MTDLPPGAWSMLAVGHQWPDSTSLKALAAAAASRRASSISFEAYAATLQSIRESSLSQQMGMTAEVARNIFIAGEDQARQIADKNRATMHAYDAAHQAVQQLRAQLFEIAEHANAEILQIHESAAPVPAKLAKTVDVVTSAQSEANSRAASQAASVFSAIQNVIDGSDLKTSAREYAKAKGVDLEAAYGSPSRDAVSNRVRTLLDHGTPTGRAHSGYGPELSDGTSMNGSPMDRAPAKVDATQESSLSESFARGNTTPSTSPASAQSVSDTTGRLSDFARIGSVESVDLSHQHEPNIADALRAGSAPASTNPLSATVASQAVSGQSIETYGVGGPATPLLNSTQPNISPPLSTATSTPGFTPDAMAHNFNAGAHAGAPISAGAEAVSTNAMHSMQAQAPAHSPGIAAPSVPAATPVFETAHAAHAPADPAPQPTVVAAPVAHPAPVIAAPPQQIAAAPITSAGPLPAYGSDLRPPAATTPAGLPPTPAAPGSAPVNVANPSSSLGQAPVVRQQSAGMPHANVAAALTERAVAASATGSVVGAVAAQSIAQHRLHRLLVNVARQEPQLRWAIADRKDGTTVLTTDLASGWIPPHIQIPSDVILLNPELRRGAPEDMLGPAIAVATYSPGQPLAATNGAEPVMTSIRPRQTAEVDELSWELTQATKWRDGLPRLAHTLARALSAGTGCLDSEIDLLSQALDGVANQILKGYPDTVDRAIIGNWQLLATIDALVRDETTCANYHLAWFRALTLTGSSRVRQ